MDEDGQSAMAMWNVCRNHTCLNYINSGNEVYIYIYIYMYAYCEYK